LFEIYELVGKKDHHLRPSKRSTQKKRITKLMHTKDGRLSFYNHIVNAFNYKNVQIIFLNIQFLKILQNQKNYSGRTHVFFHEFGFLFF